MSPRQSAPEPRDALAADRERAFALTPVSRETQDRLTRFVDLLQQWQRATNLVAPSTLRAIWTRHVADSLQLLPLVPPEAKVLVDLGSGGGFPGIVLACALAERPGVIVYLVESNRKKAAFLREAIRVTGAPAIVQAERIEDFVAGFGGQADVVTARALAPLVRLLPLVAPLLKTGGTGLFPKGQDVAAELTEASKYWTIEASQVASRTDSHSHILVVRRIASRL